MNRTLLIVVALLAVAGVLVWRFGAHSAPKVSDGPTVPLVSVITPVPGQVPSTVSLTGVISARNDMPIGVEGEGGRVVAVLVEAGDRVRRGQVLARLNPLTAQSQVASAEASLEDLRAADAAAQSEWSRAQGAPTSFSAEELDRRRTAALSARARARMAEAQLAEARSRWAHTAVLAPSDGTVLTRSAEVGQVAVPGGQPLFHLARDNQIEMRGEVAEQDMPRLAPGQVVSVRLDGLAQPFTGHVWQVGAVIDTSTRQGTVRIELPADRNLRPGAFAHAQIAVAPTPGTVLPQTAVLTDSDGTYVLIVGADQKVERRAVTLGGAHPAGLVVSGGLSGGERVIAVAGAFLRPGETVRLADDASAPASAAAGVGHAH